MGNGQTLTSVLAALLATLMALAGAAGSQSSGGQQRATSAAPVAAENAGRVHSAGLPRDYVGRDYAGKRYVGSDTCRSCHKDIDETFFHTAHFLTSRPATKESIAGSFSSGANILETANPALLYRMEAKDGGFFQTAVEGAAPEATTHSERFDVVIGSGRKGQSYLYWKGDQLFQLPVSYWTELRAWVNSPGYLDGVADFDRPILPRCLECHATYADAEDTFANRYHQARGFVLGISCEKCHGPGREHAVRYGSKNPPAASDGASDGTLVNPAKLSRAIQIDNCALCHGGIGHALAPTFSYKPGEPIGKYLQLDSPGASSNIDVHGNQVALLERSRCFQASENMTCSTCHNVHERQRDMATFSQRCLSCHQEKSCGQYPKLGHAIAQNCIDCHMPNQQTNLIVSSFNGKAVRPKVRNHWIKVYPEFATANSAAGK